MIFIVQLEQQNNQQEAKEEIFKKLITGWASYLLPQQFRGDLLTSQQQPEEGLQLDDPISENGDAEKEVTILTYV